MEINQKNIFGDNSISFGKLPREVSTASENLFISEMKNNLPTDTKITVRTYLGDAECQNFSHSINNMLKKSGWSSSILYVIPNKPVKNIMIGVPEKEKDSKTALIIYNWLKMNNFNPNATITPNEEGYIIFVGQSI